MASSTKTTSANTYEAIGNHIDERLKKSRDIIKGVRGELFDTITLGDNQKSRTEIGNKIKDELNKKLSEKKEKLQKKRSEGEVPSKREETEIANLERIIKDVEYRLGKNTSNPDVNDINQNIYMDLDNDDSFDKDIVKNVVDSILKSNMDEIRNDTLLNRLIESDKYYKEIREELSKHGKEKNVKDIIDYLKSVNEKSHGTLKEKLMDFKVNGGKALHLTDRNDIKERFSDLKVGDRIKLNDGTIIKIVKISKYGNEITFEEMRGDYGSQELTENFNKFKSYRCPEGDIKEIIIFKDSEKKTPPKPEEPKPETPKPGTPKPEEPKPETPKPEEPKPEEPKPETPKPETPKPETPKPEEPKPEEPKPETPKPETPKPETPKPETPKPEEPKPETPKPETPKPETPKPETPKPETPKPEEPEHEEREHEEYVVFKENAVLSDVSDSYEDMISREVENEINEEWNNTSRYNLFKRGDLFLRRGRIRKKRIERMKEGYERTPFTNNGTFNREMAKQASRHDLEEGLGAKRDAFGEIDRMNLIAGDETDTDDTPRPRFERKEEFRKMAQDYISGAIDKKEFTRQFNKFIKDSLNLPKEQQFLGTNVLEKLDAIKNDNTLLKSITVDLESYLRDHNNSHFDAIRQKIDNDFKKYRKDPRFRTQILKIIGNSEGLNEKDLDKAIERFIKHEQALAKASMTNLQIKLDLLTNGKGAYQTNNKDRENWLFKIGNKLDKMPRWGQALTVAGISASGVAVGLLGGSALAATATVSGLVGAKTAIKKYTHHTKEQNTYEKNLTRNYEEEIEKMKEWERIRTEKDSEGKYTNSWFKRYRAKRQLELYGNTTQAELQDENEGNTKEITDCIYVSLDNYDTLRPDEINMLNCTLLDAMARLETYWAMGHNFLKSKDANKIEREFYELENALNLSSKRIIGPSATLKDLSGELEAYQGGKEVNYADLLKKYKKDYNSASKEFRYERRWLATKWGVGTAAITFGTSAAIQAATGTGMFAKDAVAGTPGTPDSTSTTSTGNVTDSFGMGKYELSGGNNIFQTAQDNISGLNPSDSVTLHFGAGTDGTAVRAGSSLLDHSTYLAKLDQVKEVITSSSLNNKADLITQIDHGFATSGFTNVDLHGMRCLEAIEETVKGAGNFAGSLNISYDTALDVDGSIAHDAASRVSNVFLEISKFVPGKAGTEGVEGGAKWLVVGLPWFSNTFKRKNPIDKDKRHDERTPHDKKPHDRKPDDEEPDKEPNGIDTIDDLDDNYGAGTLNIDDGPDDGKKGGAAIIIPPVTSDEREEVIEEEITKDTEKKETTEELKNDVKNDLNKLFHEGAMDEDDFKEKYKDSERALKRLKEAKEFWERFPKTNFYDRTVISSLKEVFKENDYILERIKKELNSGLDPEFKHYLEESEINRYTDKAKKLVDTAISYYGKYMFRPVVAIKVSDDLTVPFYLSSGLGEKPGVPKDHFYPFFGIGSDGRLNKGVESEINNYYDSPLLAAIAKELDKRYKDKSLNVEGGGPTDSQPEAKTLLEEVNLGKSPADRKSGGYNNINEVLNKVSKIKETD